MTVADDHKRALRATGDIVAKIGVEQFDWPTPCEDWEVRDLLGHVVSGNLWVRELMDGKTVEEVDDRLSGDVLGSDHVAAYQHSADLAGAAFFRAGAMERPVAVSYGPVPGEVYCGHRFMDILIHGWDLARATGQDTTLDPGLVESLIAVLEPQLEGLRASGAFNTDVDVPADADPQTKLLAWMGRRP